MQRAQQWSRWANVEPKNVQKVQLPFTTFVQGQEGPQMGCQNGQEGSTGVAGS